MAVRKRLYHPDEVKEKIRVSQLVNMLQQDAFGLLRTAALGTDGRPLRNADGTAIMVPYELSDGRRASARFLIERVIPRAEAPRDFRIGVFRAYGSDGYSQDALLAADAIIGEFAAIGTDSSHPAAAANGPVLPAAVLPAPQGHGASVDAGADPGGAE